VLKVYDYRENDKIVWLYSDKLGKISAVAKGAKKSKSKLFSITLPFCFGEYSLFKGNSMYVLTEGKIIESFQGFLKDLDILTYASYMCELIDISTLDEESNLYLFKTLVSAFYLLNTQAVDIDTLLRVYELNVLKSTGYGINIDNCCICRKKIDHSEYISLQYHGGICHECPKDMSFKISKAAYKVLRVLNNISIENIYRLTIPKDIKKELEKLLNIFITNNYSRAPKSLQILNFIKESEENE